MSTGNGHAQDIRLTTLGQRGGAPGEPRLTARTPLSGPHQTIRSLYIHVPFCFHKCHYCDFYSFVDTRDQQGAYLDRLERELTALAPHAAGEPLRTVFIGGGTPTLLAVPLWERLLRRLASEFDLSEIRAGTGEFTVECNPETVSPSLMGTLRAGGVNRVSVGAQSFEPRHLKTLERWHDPENVERAIALARGAGIPRQSIDLIFGIPGQTLEEWDTDLRRAVALGTTHVSCYDLTYEPNTAMTARLKAGEFAPADEDVEAEMFALAAERLDAGGLHRYEVSNYARPGDECRHNLAYWRQEPWLAAGPSASGHCLAAAGGSWRWKNVARLGDWLAVDDGGYAPVVDAEPPDPARLARERIMTGLRLSEGIDARELASSCDPVIDRLVRRGWVRRESDRVKLTAPGWLFADAAAAELMAAVSVS